MTELHVFLRVFQEDVDPLDFLVRKVNAAPLVLSAPKVLQDVRVTRVLKV